MVCGFNVELFAFNFFPPFNNCTLVFKFSRSDSITVPVTFVAHCDCSSCKKFSNLTKAHVWPRLCYFFVAKYMHTLIFFCSHF